MFRGLRLIEGVGLGRLGFVGFQDYLPSSFRVCIFFGGLLAVYEV